MSFIIEVFQNFTALDILILFMSGVFGALINAFAGGGTMIVFPLLLSMNIAPISANATSKLSLILGNITAAYSFRHYAKEVRYLIPLMGTISVVFGALGGYLTIILGNDNFQFFIPWLILMATFITWFGNDIRRFLEKDTDHIGGKNNRIHGTTIALQIFSALYGGFFGAGVGIFLIAALNLMGVKSIHAINFIKHIMSILMSSAAIFIYIYVSAVNWPMTCILILGAIVGGALGGAIGKKIEPRSLKNVMIFLGFVLTAIYFKKYWFV